LPRGLRRWYLPLASHGCILSKYETFEHLPKVLVRRDDGGRVQPRASAPVPLPRRSTGAPLPARLYRQQGGHRSGRGAEDSCSRRLV